MRAKPTTGNDTISGTSGNDSIDLNAGDDNCAAGGGNDSVFGNTGNDSVHGGAGADSLDGGAGADTLQGGFGADSLNGGDGNDVLYGDAGDILYGGAGRDVFMVSAAFDRNNIKDFNAAEDTVTVVPKSTVFGAKYYTIASGIQTLDQINFAATPAFSENVAAIAYSSTKGSFYTGGASDYFAAVYSSTFEVASAGTYAFKLTSDDGSRLYIDGEAVIDMPRLQSATAREASVALDAGVHEIEVRYFEAGGDAVLKLEWDQPGGSALFETMVL